MNDLGQLSLVLDGRFRSAKLAHQFSSSELGPGESIEPARLLPAAHGISVDDRGGQVLLSREELAGEPLLEEISFEVDIFEECRGQRIRSHFKAGEQAPRHGDRLCIHDELLRALAG